MEATTDDDKLRAILAGWELVYEKGWWRHYSTDDFFLDALKNLGIDDERATQIVDESGEEYFELSHLSTTDDETLANFVLKSIETF